MQLHPWCQQREIVNYCHENRIIVEAYSPLVRNQKSNNETLISISKNYNKTPQQVLIRYSLQKGWVTLPKSDNPERIKANCEIFDFDISAEDMAALDALDEGERGSIVQAVNNS